MYIDPRAHVRICPVCGDTLTAPTDGACAICFHDETHGLLVMDDSLDMWVHQHCLNFFGVDNLLQFEQQYRNI